VKQQAPSRIPGTERGRGRAGDRGVDEGTDDAVGTLLDPCGAAQPQLRRDPIRPGPAIAGASEELLLARVVRGEYPPGYVPKRPDSGAMARFPQLEGQIPALAAYLAAVEEPAGGS